MHRYQHRPFEICSNRIAQLQPLLQELQEEAQPPEASSVMCHFEGEKEGRAKLQVNLRGLRQDLRQEGQPQAALQGASQDLGAGAVDSFQDEDLR